MDIPAISMSIKQAQLKQEVGVSIAKMVLDSAKGEGASLLKMMDVNTDIVGQLDPNLGWNIDTFA